jgi:translation initiation factor 4E
METLFKNKWKLWYHSDKDNWTLSGYENIYTIENIKDFWKLYNFLSKNNNILSKHFFLMKDNVNPIWEDENNINGGCWSFKILDTNAYKLYEELSMYLVCEKICPMISDEIMGISICLKKNNNVIIKIWNNNSKNNSLKFINENILNKWGLDIIYIAHMINK